MSTIWTLFRATAVVAGSSAALLMGGLMGTAHADPAPPVPAPNIGQQLVTSAAGAPQVLQNLATALGGQPPTPPPLASAAIRVAASRRHRRPSGGHLRRPGRNLARPGASRSPRRGSGGDGRDTRTRDPRVDTDPSGTGRAARPG